MSKKVTTKKQTKSTKKATKKVVKVEKPIVMKTYQVEYRVLFLTTVEAPNRRGALAAWSDRTGLNLGDDGRVEGHDQNSGSTTVPGDPGIEGFTHSKIRTEIVTA
jgi:hypothetical protein